MKYILTFESFSKNEHFEVVTFFVSPSSYPVNAIFQWPYMLNVFDEAFSLSNYCYDNLKSFFSSYHGNHNSVTQRFIKIMQLVNSN